MASELRGSFSKRLSQFQYHRPADSGKLRSPKHLAEQSRNSTHHQRLDAVTETDSSNKNLLPLFFEKRSIQRDSAKKKSLSSFAMNYSKEKLVQLLMELEREANELRGTLTVLQKSMIRRDEVIQEQNKLIIKLKSELGRIPRVNHSQSKSRSIELKKLADKMNDFDLAEAANLRVIKYNNFFDYLFSNPDVLKGWRTSFIDRRDLKTHIDYIEDDPYYGLLKEIGDKNLSQYEMRNIFIQHASQTRAVFKSAKENYEAKIHGIFKLQALCELAPKVGEMDFEEISSFFRKLIREEVGCQDARVFLVEDKEETLYYWDEKQCKIMGLVLQKGFQDIKDSGKQTKQFNLEQRSSDKAEDKFEKAFNIVVRNQAVTKVETAANELIGLIICFNKQKHKDSPSDEKVYFTADNINFLNLMSKMLCNTLKLAIIKVKSERQALSFRSVITVISCHEALERIDQVLRPQRLLGAKRAGSARAVLHEQSKGVLHQQQGPDLRQRAPTNARESMHRTRRTGQDSDHHEDAEDQHQLVCR